MDAIEIRDSFPGTRMSRFIENEIRKREGRPIIRTFNSPEELEALLDKAKAKAGCPVQVDDYRRYPNDLPTMYTPRTYMYG